MSPLEFPYHHLVPASSRGEASEKPSSVTMANQILDHPGGRGTGKNTQSVALILCFPIPRRLVRRATRVRDPW